MTREELEREFWKRVAKASGDQCWLWTGTLKTGKYGQLYRGKGSKPRFVIAHRFSYQLHYGAIPKGRMVCHHCDVPACVRPDHLFLGSSKDNVHDMYKKGRQIRKDRQAKSPFTVRLPKDLHMWLIDCSSKNGVPMSALVVTALEQYKTKVEKRHQMIFDAVRNA
jgi:hypothetical protein